MTKKTDTPAIRFKGFSDTWEQRKLGEVAKYRNGKAHENCIDESGKYIVVKFKIRLNQWHSDKTFKYAK